MADLTTRSAAIAILLVMWALTFIGTLFFFHSGNLAAEKFCEGACAGVFGSLMLSLKMGTSDPKA